MNDIVSRVKDPIIKKARLQEKGDKTRLIVDLNSEAQYKVFVLKQPNRLVLDISASAWNLPAAIWAKG